MLRFGRIDNLLKEAEDMEYYGSENEVNQNNDKMDDCI